MATMSLTKMQTNLQKLKTSETVMVQHLILLRVMIINIIDIFICVLGCKWEREDGDIYYFKHLFSFKHVCTVYICVFMIGRSRCRLRGPRLHCSNERNITFNRNVLLNHPDKTTSLIATRLGRQDIRTYILFHQTSRCFDESRRGNAYVSYYMCVYEKDTNTSFVCLIGRHWYIWERSELK